MASVLFRTTFALGFAALAAGASVSPAFADGNGPPEWAYTLNPAPLKPPVDDGQKLHVPGGEVELTRTQLLDRFTAVDWRPGSHPPIPDPAGHGRKPDLWACGYCHYPNGQGRPENAALAGLPAKYIVEQVAAVRDGSRASAQPAMLAPPLMKKAVSGATDADVLAAAAYFSSLTYKPWIRVVETDTVPKTEVTGVSYISPTADGATEPLGERIVEVSENPARSALRDDEVGFVAYVPVGAVKAGQAIATQASGDRQPCATCHGEGLRGGEIGPPIAGRAPGYLFRQLYDIQQGTRHGDAVSPMVAEVAGLSPADMLRVVAYVASLAP